MDPNCIFCKIISGEMPSTKIYEDDHCLAFLDINPVSKGHTLVIPRKHCDPIMDTPDDVLQKVIVIVRKIARAQMAGLQAEAINVTQANGKLAGQEVPHIHFHVIPRKNDATAKDVRNWIPGAYDSPDEMSAFGDRIRQALES